MYRYISLNLDLPLNIRAYQWLQICKVNGRQWVYVMVKGLLCQLVYYLIPLNATMAWHPAEADTKWEGCRCLRPQLPASKTLSQSRLRHRAIQDPCADISSVPRWWLLPQRQRWYCYLGVFWTAGGKSSHHSGNGGWWPLLPPLSR